MLFLLGHILGFEGALNLVRYLSFRAGAAVATALFIGLIIGDHVMAAVFAVCGFFAGAGYQVLPN